MTCASLFRRMMHAMAFGTMLMPFGASAQYVDPSVPSECQQWNEVRKPGGWPAEEVAHEAAGLLYMGISASGHLNFDIPENEYIEIGNKIDRYCSMYPTEHPINAVIGWAIHLTTLKKIR